MYNTKGKQGIINALFILKLFFISMNMIISVVHINVNLQFLIHKI